MTSPKSNIALDLTLVGPDKWVDSQGEEPVYTNFRQNLIDGFIATMNKAGEWNRVLNFKNVAVVCQAVCNLGNEYKFPSLLALFEGIIS